MKKGKKEKEKERGLIFHTYIHVKKKGGHGKRCLYVYEYRRNFCLFCYDSPPLFFLELDFRDFI